MTKNQYLLAPGIVIFFLIVKAMSFAILLLLSYFSHVWLSATPQTAAHQVHHPWDPPGKNTGVGCHFLLQCMKVKSESEVAQSCPTLRDPMDCSPPGSSVHGIFQARVLEWGAIAFSWVLFKLHSQNNAICNNIDGPRGCHTEWSKLDTERQSSYGITYMWNLKKKRGHT